MEVLMKLLLDSPSNGSHLILEVLFPLPPAGENCRVTAGCISVKAAQECAEARPAILMNASSASIQPWAGLAVTAPWERLLPIPQLSRTRRQRRGPSSEDFH